MQVTNRDSNCQKQLLSHFHSVSWLRSRMTRGPVVSDIVPSGQVSCLLCSQFVSVEAGDRARFIDHLTARHEVKSGGHEVILATSVLTGKEKGFIIKTANRRLDQIGAGRTPDYEDSFLNKLVGQQQVQEVGHQEEQVRHQEVQSRRIDVRSRPHVVQSRPHVVQSSRPQGGTDSSAAFRGAIAASLRAVASKSASKLGKRNTSSLSGRSNGSRISERSNGSKIISGRSSGSSVSNKLPANSSISISKVDTRKTCHMCNTIVAGPDQLVKHINSAHFSNLGAVNIMSGSVATTDKESLAGNTSMVKCGECGKSVLGSKLAFHQMLHKGPGVRRDSTMPRGNANRTRETKLTITGGNQGMRGLPTVPLGLAARKHKDVAAKRGDGVRSERSDKIVDKAKSTRSTPESSVRSEGNVSKETDIKEEIKGLQTTELLDNLVSFLET